MKNSIKFPEKLYIGIKAVDLDPATASLAFATPYGTDKAFLKRKETVDSWVGIKYVQTKNSTVSSTHIIDNEPIRGFSFDKAVSRYTTQNKWFRITDPRGFILEIDAYNLADIIANTSIFHGELCDEFVWGRNNANNFLTRTTHPDYIEHVKNTISPPEKYVPEIGDIVNLTGTDNMVYLGKYYVSKGNETCTYRDPVYSYSQKRRIIYKYSVETSKKLHHVFLYVGEHTYYTNRVKVLTSVPKNIEKVKSGYDISSVDTSTWFTSIGYGYKIKIFEKYPENPPTENDVKKIYDRDVDDI